MFLEISPLWVGHVSGNAWVMMLENDKFAS